MAGSVEWRMRSGGGVQFGSGRFVTPLSVNDEASIGTNRSGTVLTEVTLPDDLSGNIRLWFTTLDRNRSFRVYNGELVGQQYNGDYGGMASVRADISNYAGDRVTLGFYYQQDDGDGNQVLELYAGDSVLNTTTHPATTSASNGNDYLFGRNGDAPPRMWRVCVYPGKTTAQERVSVGSGDPSVSSLALYYKLDDPLGRTTALDSSSNGIHATLEDGARFVADPSAVDSRLIDVEDVTLAYNRFARSATAVLDDPDGTVPDEYPKPHRVTLDVKRRIDDNWRHRFGGFVSGNETSKNRTKLELLSHDHWLRSRDVNRDFSDRTRKSVLEELVTDLTPLEWNPDLVDVYSNDTITRKWRGEKLDQAIESLASGSNGEYFGATGDMEFFFLQPSTSDANRDFVPGEYFEADFETEGEYELNEVTVNYGGDPANQAVIVEDRARQRELGDGLGIDRNVVLSDSKTFTSIDSEEEAKARGRELLEDATPIQTGTVTTWDAFDVEPGDIVYVSVPEQQVEGEFRVAEIVHTGWVDDNTELTLAENSDGVVDTLVELSDEVDRIDARAASDDKTITRFTDLGLDFAIEIDVTATKREIDPDQFTFGELQSGFGEGNGKLGDRRGRPEEIDLSQ